MTRYFVTWNTGSYTRTGKRIVDVFETDDRTKADAKFKQLERDGFDSVSIVEEEW